MLRFTVCSLSWQRGGNDTKINGTVSCNYGRVAV